MKNHDKIIKNRDRLFEHDKDIRNNIVANKVDTEEFAQKVKQRQKFVRIIDKLETTNRHLSNASSSDDKTWRIQLGFVT